jgi:hypothetical protein
MNESRDTLRRVLIALDPAAPRSEIFAALAALMDEAGTELHGLYVEDERLFRLASLPCAREVRVSLPGQRQFLAAELEKDVQEYANRVREAFEAEARRMRLRHRFSVHRGDVLGVIQSEATDTDLLVIGRSLISAGTRTWHGVTVTRIVAGHPRASLLFVNEPWETGHTVAVLTDASDGAARGLRMGRQIAERENLDLVILVVPGEEEVAQLPAGAEQRTLSQLDNERLGSLCAELDARVLILADSEAVHSHVDLATLIEALPTSIILVPCPAEG